MKILGVDLTANYSSVAIKIDDDINSISISHSTYARPDWDKLLNNLFPKEIILDDLDAVAYANGPGSFTSLRSAAAFTKAIAASKKIPLIPVSSLKAMAWESKKWVKQLPYIIHVCNVAEKENLYYAAYNLDSNKIDVVTEPTLVTKDFINQIFNNEDYLIGDAWEDESFASRLVTDYVSFSADAVVSIASSYIIQKKSFSDSDIEPIYLTNPNYRKIKDD